MDYGQRCGSEMFMYSGFIPESIVNDYIQVDIKTPSVLVSHKLYLDLTLELNSTLFQVINAMFGGENEDKSLGVTVKKWLTIKCRVQLTALTGLTGIYPDYERNFFTQIQHQVNCI